MFKEQLKLKKEYKEMIQALVSSHESKNSKKAARPQVKDVVEDKGKGLVILLHGRLLDLATPQEEDYLTRYDRPARCW